MIINEHLAVCDSCYQRYSEMYTLHDGRDYIEIDWTVNQSSAHLDFKELVLYVDGHMNETERAFVEIHLSQCAHCAREVRELREFAKRLKDEP